MSALGPPAAARTVRHVLPTAAAAHAPVKVHAWAELEATFAACGYRGADPGAVRARTGSRPLLLTAPHAVTHTRRGAAKLADMGTGGLAEVLALQHDTHSLTMAGPDTADGNYDPHGAFKTALLQRLPAVHTVLDLHGMQDCHGPDVCIGRGPQRLIADDVIDLALEHLRGHGFTVSLDAPFNARHEHTVTATAQHAGVPAIQLEIRRGLRTGAPGDERRARFLKAMSTLVERLVH